MKNYKNLILLLILVFCVISISFAKTKKGEEDSDSKDDEPVTNSHSYSKSVFYSSSNINGKKRSRYSKRESEEHRSKRGNNPAKIRKFHQKWDKRNDGPLVHQKKAFSNDPEERKYLRNKWRKRLYSEREEKKFMRKFHKNFSGKFWKKWWKKGFFDDDFEKKYRNSKFWKYLARRKREIKRKLKSKEIREISESDRDYLDNY